MRVMLVALLLTSCATTPVAVRPAVVVEPSVVPVPHVKASVASRGRTARPWVLSGRWREVAMCESSLNPRAVGGSGRYEGLFQMDAAFWRTYGGLMFAPSPARATAHEQYVVALRGYQARGSQPWPRCGRFLHD